MSKGCLIFIPGINSITHKERLTARYDFPRGGLSMASFLASKGKKVNLIPLDYYVPPSENPAEISSRLRYIVHSSIEYFDPSLVGIGVPYTMLYPTALRIASFCKEVSEAVVCLGGPHVSYTARQTLIDSNDVDVIVRGEGEWTLLELLEKVERKEDFSDLAGTTARNAKFGEGDGELAKVNPPRPLGNLNELPPFDYGLLPEIFVRNMAVTIMGSRGCAYNCSYCVEQEFWRHKVRTVAIDTVAEEIRILSERYDNPPVSFEDSMFDMRSSRFFEFCTKVKGISLHPECYLLSRVDSVTDDGFKAMKAAGINNLWLGVESASPKVLAAMNKRITFKQSEEACRRGTEAGLTVGSFWLVGHPGDSLRESEITLEAIHKIYSWGYSALSEIAMFIPYPGTAISENPDAYGIDILTYDWEKWARFNTEPVCQLKEFKKEDILRCWHHAQRIVNGWRLIRGFPGVCTEPVVLH